MQYKPEIDGLRSVAVLGVLFFHLGINFLPGGFIGVDVFFVISGYLITRIIASEVQQQKFSYLDFYKRRILRILPPLTAMLVFCIVLSWCFLLPVEIIDFGKSLTSVSLFISNIHFFQNINYFNPESDYTILLHTWSLSIEEQFYFIVPVFIIILLSNKIIKYKEIFLLTVIASLLLSFVLIFKSQTATFYLLPTRYWELGIGSLIALYGLELNFQKKWANAISIFGFFLIIGSMFLLNDKMSFPGPLALIPVFGAAIIIVTGRSGLFGRVLATKLPVSIGKISYALYLWHWPLIVFYKILINPELDIFAVAAILIASFIMAIASYILIEEPIRKNARNIVAEGGIAGSLFAIIIFGGIGVCMQKFANIGHSYPQEISKVAGYEDYTKTKAAHAQYRLNQCFITSSAKKGFETYDKEVCLKADTVKSNYLLLGDSQAAHLWQGLQTARPDLNLMQATASGCKPLIKFSGEKRCVEMMRYILNDWLATHDVDVVILAARWEAEDLGELEETISFINKDKVVKVVVLGPTVEYVQSLPLILARQMQKKEPFVYKFKDKDRKYLDKEMEARFLARNIRYISTYDVVCPQDSCIESLGGIPMQSDYGHFTDAGGNYVAAKVAANF